MVASFAVSPRGLYINRVNGRGISFAISQYHPFPNLSNSGKLWQNPTPCWERNQSNSSIGLLFVYFAYSLWSLNDNASISVDIGWCPLYSAMMSAVLCAISTWYISRTISGRSRVARVPNIKASRSPMISHVQPRLDDCVSAMILLPWNPCIVQVLHLLTHLQCFPCLEYWV